jgi:ATP-dependent Clp protease ATP-binding subunit ClpC
MLPNGAWILNLSDKAKAFIAEKVLISNLAQDHKRAIQKYVEDSLAEEIITLKFSLEMKLLILEEGAQE